MIGCCACDQGLARHKGGNRTECSRFTRGGTIHAITRSLESLSGFITRERQRFMLEPTGCCDQNTPETDLYSPFCFHTRFFTRAAPRAASAPLPGERARAAAAATISRDAASSSARAAASRPKKAATISAVAPSRFVGRERPVQSSSAIALVGRRRRLQRRAAAPFAAGAGRCRRHRAAPPRRRDPPSPRPPRHARDSSESAPPGASRAPPRRRRSVFSPRSSHASPPPASPPAAPPALPCGGGGAGGHEAVVGRGRHGLLPALRWTASSHESRVEPARRPLAHRPVELEEEPQTPLSATHSFPSPSSPRCRSRRRPPRAAAATAARRCTSGSDACRRRPTSRRRRRCPRSRARRRAERRRPPHLRRRRHALEDGLVHDLGVGGCRSDGSPIVHMEKANAAAGTSHVPSIAGRGAAVAAVGGGDDVDAGGRDLDAGVVVEEHTHHRLRPAEHARASGSRPPVLPPKLTSALPTARKRTPRPFARRA